MFPCYADLGKNIVGIGATKHYAAIWFFQGAILQDELGVLTNAQENKTKAMRQWRMKSIDQLDLEKIQLYVYEAIGNQRAGLEIKPNLKKPLVIPTELEQAFNKDPKLRKAFVALSKSSRRDFAEHIGDAKREETRLRRLQKSIPMVLSGVALYEKYKKN